MPKSLAQVSVINRKFDILPRLSQCHAAFKSWDGSSDEEGAEDSEHCKLHCQRDDGKDREIYQPHQLLWAVGGVHRDQIVSRCHAFNNLLNLVSTSIRDRYLRLRLSWCGTLTRRITIRHSLSFPHCPTTTRAQSRSSLRFSRLRGAQSDWGKKFEEESFITDIWCLNAVLLIDWQNVKLVNF